MRWLRYAVLVVLLLVAALWGAARVVPRWQARHVTPVMTAYLRAAAAGDSIALVHLTTSLAPIRWALFLHRDVPAFLDEAATRGRPEWVIVRGETTIVSFRLPRPVPDPTCPWRPLHNVQGRFLRGADNAWRLLSAIVPVC